MIIVTASLPTCLTFVCGLKFAAMAFRQQQNQRQPFEYDGAADFSEEESAEELKGPISEMEDYVRRDFVRKVYSILSIQLMITFLVAAPFPLILGPEFMKSQAGVVLYHVCMLTSIGMVLGLVCCCQSAIRTYPTNYIFLFTFTIVEACVVGMISSMYTTNSVLLAVASTTVVFLALTAFACCTEIDFTGMGIFLYGALMCMMGFGFVLMMWQIVAPPLPSALHLVYSALGVLLFSFYIIYDTQLIIGGRHKTHQFEVDDYAFAALNLYLDIINLFLYLLSLLGNRN